MQWFGHASCVFRNNRTAEKYSPHLNDPYTQSLFEIQLVRKLGIHFTFVDLRQTSACWIFFESLLWLMASLDAIISHHHCQSHIGPKKGGIKSNFLHLVIQMEMPVWCQYLIKIAVQSTAKAAKIMSFFSSCTSQPHKRAISMLFQFLGALISLWITGRHCWQHGGGKYVCSIP